MIKSSDRTLLESLRAIAEDGGDRENDHYDADQQLLDYIEKTTTRGTEIRQAFENIKKWYP